MTTKPLGNSDLALTPIGFGAWAIGGGNWQFAWGHQEDSDSIEAIHRSLDLGINWIDTAAVYGLGHSEEVVAKALKTSSHKPYVFTKSTMTWGEDRKIVQTMKKIQEECEASLLRLGVETIDLYQIHWPVPDEEIEEGWAAMAELQKQGKVRYIGVSNFNVSQMERALKIAPITSLQPPYSMLNRTVEPEILPFCEKNNIGVINYSPMQSGLLTGAMTRERIDNMPEDDFRKTRPQFKEPLLTRNLELVELLRSIGSSHQVNPGVVAVAWTLHHSAVTAAIVGGRSGKQVEELMPAATFRLSESEFQQINDFLAAHP
ncbi:aldo/keto reductase [Granulicella sp. WH15]|uniref:aldo/keto reductase n=1 Tax=Granulicella sp. WH15 TaxID=2602070 RepID=UPI0013672F59|nr:aldo/keto reductase [Granulicella sp. WH15]QHN03289.1 aldo/keto reductase [Granulicella sp. WH15]